MRTKTPEIIQPSRRTKISEEAYYLTRCWWPCPCGGWIPDAPSHCAFAKRRGKNKSDRCADIITCVRTCMDYKECSAYQKARQIMKMRHKQDIINGERKDNENNNSN